MCGVWASSCSEEDYEGFNGEHRWNQYYCPEYSGAEAKVWRMISGELIGNKKKAKKKVRKKRGWGGGEGGKSPCSLQSEGIDALQWWGCRGNSSQSLLSWLAGIVKMAQVMCCVQLFRSSYSTVRDLARPIIQGTKAVLLDMDYCNCISSPLCEY